MYDVRGGVCLKQYLKGSPVKPFKQAHIGLWLITLQSEFDPQAPGHGSMHFWLTQALSCGHSALTVHSGLQPGGLPTYVGKHEHTACLLTSLH